MDGSRGGWDVECPRGLRAVLEQSWRALLCREALVDPVPDRRPFAWFAWLQRAHIVSRCLFGFVGCTGQRLGTQRCRLWDCFGLAQPQELSLWEMLWTSRAGPQLCAPRSPSSLPSLLLLHVPGCIGSPSHPCYHPTEGNAVCCLQRCSSSPLQGLLFRFHFRLQHRIVFRCVPCLLCGGGGL